MPFVNPNKPSGLSPIRYLNGANYDGKAGVYSILAANTNPFFVGDLVVPITGGGGVSGIPAVTLATAGNPAIGVVIAVGPNVGSLFTEGGPFINVNNLNVVNRPSGAQPVNYFCAVSDDPNIIYEIQEGNTGTNLTSAALMRNANILYSAPATGVNVSGTVLDNTTVAVTATLNLKLMKFVRRIDNNFLTTPATGGAAQKWEVMINNHFLRAGIASL